MRLLCGSINVRERPWASKRQPIDYKRCCTDRLNAQLQTMRRRKFITLIGSAVTLPFVRAPVAEAQEPGRIYRLGVITGAPRQAPRNIALFDELKGLGFVEGQNLKIVVAGFGLRDEQFAEAAATLVKSAPDAIFCVSNRAVRAAQESTRTVPIVA